MFASRWQFELVRPTEIGPLRGAWHELARRQRCSPFALPAFFEAWCAAFGDRRVAFVVIGRRRRGREVELVLPLWHARERPGEWRTLGGFRADYTEPVAAASADGIGDALWSWLAVAAPCRSAKISRMPADSPIARAADRHRQRRRDVARAVVTRGRVRYLEIGSEHEHPFADRAQIERGAERLDSRHGRRNTAMLAKHGAVSYAVVRDPPEIASLLSPLFDMHVANFTGTGRSSQFTEPAERAFYLALAAHPELAGIACMDVLRVGERFAALHFGFELDRQLYWYKPSFDLALAKASPGKTLLSHVFARAAADGFERIDLLKGLEPYKDEWASGNRATTTATVVDRGVVDVFDDVVRRAIGAAR